MKVTELNQGDFFLNPGDPDTVFEVVSIPDVSGPKDVILVVRATPDQEENYTIMIPASQEVQKVQA